MRLVQIKLHILNLINNTRQRTPKQNCQSKCNENKQPEKKNSKSVNAKREQRTGVVCIARHCELYDTKYDYTNFG